jgi:hypothetical protein
VSDSWRKKRGGAPGEGAFMAIGFELFARLRSRFEPVDIVAVVRHNEKLGRGNWHKAAEAENFFLPRVQLFVHHEEVILQATIRATVQ